MSSALEDAVRRALVDVQVLDTDGGAVELAYTYARGLDAGAPPEKLGPPFLACLEALGMTPRARATIAKGGATGAKPGVSTLDELRQRRRARGNGAASMDAGA